MILPTDLAMETSGTSRSDMHRRPLTPRQLEALRAIIVYEREHHYQPSVAELERILETRNATALLLAIERAGWIRLTGQSRAIEIPDDVYQEEEG